MPVPTSEWIPLFKIIEKNLLKILNYILSLNYILLNLYITFATDNVMNCLVTYRKSKNVQLTCSPDWELNLSHRILLSFLISKGISN